MKNLWFIGIKERGAALMDTSGFTVIEAPEGHYYADPFLAEEDGKTYVFYEDYDYEKGRIAVAEVDGLELKNHRIILDELKHISFPSVFKYGGEWYMVPERVLAGELWVYKAVEFPDVWEPLKKVAEGRYDDPVFKETEDGIEIWCSTDGDKLRIFRAPSMDGDWSLIFSDDAPFARSAGNFIGNVRVAQDSVPVYGRAIKFINNGEMLTIEPDWYPQLTGTHTFNVTDKYVVIDGRITL